MRKIITLLLLFTFTFSSSIFAQCNPNFFYTVYGNGIVQFSPYNTAEEHQWFFGDGTSSNSVTPLHVYATGTYNVVHIVTFRSFNDSTTILCVDSSVQLITVSEAPNCNLNASFGFVRDSVQGNRVYFNNLSSGIAPNTITSWNFGDGSSSFEINPVHVFSDTGIYSVCLTIRRGDSCVSDTCATIDISRSTNNCNLVPGFIYVRDSTPSSSNLFSFYNTTASLTNIDSTFWDFGDGTPVMINPDAPLTHHYASPGVYTVCLTVKKVQPGTINIVCERQICQTIIIDTPQTQCNLQAYFIYSADSVSVNRVYFANMSSSYEISDSLLWTFGDGSYSTDVSPEHTYNTGGTYNVCLMIERQQAPGTAPCVREYCIQVLVQQPANCNLVVNFLDSSIDNNSIYFINQSTPLSATDSIQWTFGDGTSSSDINPVHTYNQPGTYTVCLLVNKGQTSNTVCVREYCKTVTVQPACNITADFEYTQDSITGPANTILFTNTSTGLLNSDSSFWNFSDGTLLSFQPATSFTHTFPAPGTYMVCLWERRYIPGTTILACVREACKWVVVSGQTNVCDQLQADFTWTTDSSNNNRILFNNQSSPLSANTYVAWGFGDGDSSTAYNPAHIYNQPGTYLVCLRIGLLGTPCVKDTCRTITIVPSGVDSCNLQPGFTTQTDSANRRKVFFTNTTVAPSSAAFAVWSFGDGTTATGWNQDHTYAVPGWYIACLTVGSGNNTNCTRTYCDSIFVPGNVIPPYTCDSFQLQIGYRRDENLPNKFFFYATGNAPVYNQQWSFIKLAPDSATVVINQNTPVFVFPDTGLYRVCVQGSFSTNCSGNSCTDVRITSTSAPVPRFVRSYPNPAHNNVSFNLQLNQPGQISVSVMSLNNVEVMRYTQQGTSGNNLVTLNVRKLTPGFYVARIHYPGGVSRTRFVKF